MGCFHVQVAIKSKGTTLTIRIAVNMNSVSSALIIRNINIQVFGLDNNIFTCILYKAIGILI